MILTPDVRRVNRMLRSVPDAMDADFTSKTTRAVNINMKAMTTPTIWQREHAGCAGVAVKLKSIKTKET